MEKLVEITQELDNITLIYGKTSRNNIIYLYAQKL